MSAKRKNVATTLPFHDEGFMKSPEARVARLVCEFSEPPARLQKEGVKGAIVFFGSARAMLRDDFDHLMTKLKDDSAAATDAKQKEEIEGKIKMYQKREWMCEWAEKTRELAKLLTQWSVTPAGLAARDRLIPDFLRAESPNAQPILVCSGGGPGMMEAANRGAEEAFEGAKSIGMGITLPFEAGLNPYVTPGLQWEFKYFFTRKFWEVYLMRALVLCPGGMGTCDELFEVFTLVQCKKIPPLPVVLLGTQFWKTMINWQSMADYAVASQEEIDSLFFADTAEEAFTYITQYLEHGRAPPKQSSA